jgi:hypothetical protein
MGITMNVVYPQENVVIAKTCGCKENNRNKVTYAFSEEFHSLCMDKKDIIQAEIEACERLLKYATSESERVVVEKEIADLRIALDLMP